MKGTNYPVEIEIEVEKNIGQESIGLSPAQIREIASDIVKEYKGITYAIALKIVENDRWDMLGRYNKRDL